MREEIIREYLSKGKLLTPDALEMLMKGESLDGHEGVMVTSNDIKNTPQGRFTILKNITKKPSELTTDNFVKFYRSKYEKSKDIILSRLQKNFVSLNKLDSYRSEVYVIGMVRDIREKDNKTVIELEDPTASLPILFDKDDVHDVDLDDVIAVKAISARNVLFGKQIIFPDVPLRQPVTGVGKACFVSDLNLHIAPKTDAEKFFSWLGMEDVQWVFVAGNIGDGEAFENYVERHCGDKTFFVIPGEHDTKDKYPQTPLKYTKQNIITLSNPSMVDVDGLMVLLARNFNTGMIKKRHLGKSECILEEDDLVMDVVPDIVCFGHQNSQVTNYKSISIVCSGSMMGSFRPVIINLKTREITQAQLS